MLIERPEGSHSVSKVHICQQKLLGKIIRFEYQLLFYQTHEIIGEVTDVRLNGIYIRNEMKEEHYYVWHNLRGYHIKVFDEVEAMIWKLETK